MSRRARALAAIGGLVAGLGASVWLALGVGAAPPSWRELLGLLGSEEASAARTILFGVRLPRIALAALVGGALSAAGVVFQAVLRNPLADPYVLGVSGGAALGAVGLAVLSRSAAFASPVGGPASAFAGAMLSVLLLVAARVRGRTQPVALLLVGVILNAFFSALILFLLTAGDPAVYQHALHYLVGVIRPLEWGLLAAVGVVVVAGIAALLTLTQRLNVLALGEEAASQLGLDVERTVWLAITLASLVTAGAVAFTGLVGFVGLIAPHVVRTLVGPDHRLLLPAATLAGAAFVVLADTAARTLIAPAELPVGAITALAGAPFFLFVFLRDLRRGTAP